MANEIDAVVMFSGGLDSVLSARLLEAQGLKLLCAHCVSPFFGNAAKIPYWEKIYGLRIVPIDVGRDFVNMLVNGPAHGFGSTINPCVDCKILLFKAGRALQEKLGAKFLASGEVLGQRPMSQRRDTLNTIQNKAGVQGRLLRPLSAQRLEATQMENEGLVDRSALLAIQGRGRQEQLELATKFGLTEIPAPAGGCVLTEKENGRRYWPVIKKWRSSENTDPDTMLSDFKLARMGRQFWRGTQAEAPWLCVGRNRQDNQALQQFASSDDVTIKLQDRTGPLGLARHGAQWPDSLLYEACSVVASHCPKISPAEKVKVSLFSGSFRKTWQVQANRLEQLWNIPDWPNTRVEIRLAAQK